MAGDEFNSGNAEVDGGKGSSSGAAPPFEKPRSVGTALFVVGHKVASPQAFPARAFGRADTKSCLRRKNFELSGDRPAVPRQLGDWAEESRLPMLLTVCIEAGRKTLTHTSWTGLTPGSRKWMSGQAAALAATQDRTPFANSTAARSLRDPTLPSARRPPSPLDFYLSWMSPHCPQCGKSAGRSWWVGEG